MRGSRGWRSGRLPRPMYAAAPVFAGTPGQLAPGFAVRSPFALFEDGLPWKRVGFGVGYLAVLSYFIVLVTQRWPLGTASLAVGVLLLPFSTTKVRLPTPLIWFGLYVMWCNLTVPSGIAPEMSRKAATELTKLWVICFLVVNMVRTTAQLRFVMFWILFWFAIYPMRGTFLNFFIVHETLFGRAKWNAVYANPNDLAMLTMQPLGFCIVLLRSETRKSFKYLAGLGAALCVFIILLTQSRGAWIGLFAGVGWGITHAGKARGKFILIVLVGGLIAAVAAPKGTFNRFRALTQATDLKEADPEGSAEARYNIWRVARSIVADRPTMGVGLGTYPVAHFLYEKRIPDLPAASRGGKDTHSTYLNIAAEVGIPGLTIWLAMVLSTLGVVGREVRRRRPIDPLGADLLSVVLLSFVAVLFCSIFGSYGMLAHVYVQIALMMTFVCVSADHRNRALAASR